MSKKVTKIGVLTSGGDSPGMNAAIRAVVRTALYYGLDVFGIYRGYNGMIEDDIVQRNSRSVANIIQRGGTILKTARSKEFYSEEGRKKAFENLAKRGIDGLVVIGGDGSFTGAYKLSQEFGIPCIGIPGTIDKIRDTADAHDRLFIVEVMGRHAGYIALHSGIATGAENILIPEEDTTLEEVIASLSEKEKRKKLVNLVVVAEGHNSGGATGVAEFVKKHLPNLDTRVTILGHIQRGGSPTCLDRLIASRMGYHAVESLMEGRHNVMVGILENAVHNTPIDVAIREKQMISDDWLKNLKILAS